ncbi:Arc-like DNA binding dprotein [Rhodobacter sp. JA431]|uniref:Arc family DNA-binding protein n=1 Tax=Rhodobacter sp. JA431 TaxID=570013 RepID=UPI000BC3F22A|nr:Arc family DNA-binding protein [Rhodobacter sp. JA431]SOB98832.1 Arc-like DNA binding dprotein [Rhodobacter sp. JA431]
MTYDRKPMQLRLPPELKDWIKEQAECNGRSQNSEVVQVIRAAKTRTEEAAA